MRLPILVALFAVLVPALAQASEPPDARSAYVERRGLQEVDRRCSLFTPGVRIAVDVGVRQARGALLRAGWTAAQVGDLEGAVVASAAARPCNDTRTQSAAANARTAFSSWIGANRMSFPGWERAWSARRAPAADGWRLVQVADEPISALFGVREHAGAQRLVLAVPVERGQRAPVSAQLVMRDATHSAMVEISLAQRVAYGIAAGAPEPAAASVQPSARTLERIDGRRSQAVFTFPDAAFRNLLTLDPRESVEVRVDVGGRVQSIFFEVGDIAAARIFLTAPAS